MAYFDDEKCTAGVSICIILLIIVAGFFFLNSGDVFPGGNNTTPTTTPTSTDTYTDTYTPPESTGYKVRMTVNWVSHNYTGADLPFGIYNDADGSLLFAGTWFLSEDGDSYTFDFIVQLGDNLNIVFDTVTIGILGLYVQWNGYDNATLGESMYATVGTISENTHMAFSSWGIIENAVDIGIEYVLV